MSWDFLKSRTFWGVTVASITEILIAAGVIDRTVATKIIELSGLVLSLMGLRGVILRSGGLKG